MQYEERPHTRLIINNACKVAFPRAAALPIHYYYMSGSPAVASTTGATSLAAAATQCLPAGRAALAPTGCTPAVELRIICAAILSNRMSCTLRVVNEIVWCGVVCKETTQ